MVSQQVKGEGSFWVIVNFLAKVNLDFLMTDLLFQYDDFKQEYMDRPFFAVLHDAHACLLTAEKVEIQILSAKKNWWSFWIA